MLDNKIKLTSQIYESKNSLIYRAIRLKDNKPIVLKKLNRGDLSPVESSRFRREFKIAQQFDHEGIIKVYDIFETDDGSLAFSMEDCGGESLYRYFDHFLELELIDKLRIALNVAEYIEQIHSLNIIHMDINPGNIVWCPKFDLIKIIDFGISTELSAEIEFISPASLEGTLPYMSPEQTGRMNRRVDYRSDLYSLGATLYELFTGRLPFLNKDQLELIHCHIAIMPKDAEAVKHDIPQVISQIISKLMAKDADNRYQSASGVKLDLQYCTEQLKKTGSVMPFQIGLNDVSAVFKIPQRLYDRSEDIASLVSVFDRTCSGGQCQMMLVSGPSGIGKTAFAGEILKSVIAKKGFFIRGKFGAMEQSMPHSTIIQAFKNLFEQLLSEPDAILKYWQKRINEAVYPNGQIVVDVIPLARNLIKDLPPVAGLEPKEATNRFIRVFVNLVSVFAKLEHPLVLFFDDLQWTDQSTLALIETFFNNKIEYLYIIGAYRDNEVPARHPLKSLIDSLSLSNPSQITNVTLKPLTAEECLNLINETLNTDAQNVKELADLCFLRTKGNPLFLLQMLNDLYSKNAFEHDGKGHWRWIPEKVSDLKVFTDVLELMTSKLIKLSKDSQHVIKVAACVDSRVSLQQLIVATGLEKQKVIESTTYLVKSGFLSPSENFKYANENIDPADVYLKFIHDRIRQAAYNMIDVTDIQAFHSQIGYQFWRKLKKKEYHNVLDAVKQLNKAIDIISAEDRLDLAILNLEVGKNTKLTSAWEQAYYYFSSGLQLINQSDWQMNYELTYELHCECAEAAIRMSEFDRVDSICKTAIDNSPKLLNQCRVHEIQLMSLIAQGRPYDAVILGLAALKKLGINIKLKTPKVFLLISLLKTKYLLRDSTKIYSEDKVMIEPYKLAASRILMRISSPAYVSGSKAFVAIVMKSVQLFVKYGYSPHAAYSLTAFGGFLGVIGDYAAGHKFGNISLDIALNRPEVRPAAARTVYVTTAFIGVYNVPYKKLCPNLLEHHAIGLETGDFEYAAFNIYCYCYLLFMSGDPLKSVEKVMDEYADNIKQQDIVNNYFMLYHQLTKNLLGKSDNPVLLSGSVCVENDIKEHMERHKNEVGLFDFFTKKSMLFYLFYDYESGLLSLENASQYLPAAMTKHDVPIYRFYQALIICAFYKGKTTDITRKHWRHLKQSIQKMKKLATYSPSSYKHKYLLMMAELSFIRSKEAMAEKYYHEAISAAQSNGFTHELAIAFELTSLFYAQRGYHLIYQHYLNLAFNTYRHWGAITKCRAMEDKYGDDLVAKSPALRLKTGGIATSLVSGGPHETTTQQTSFKDIDLMSLLKTSPLIASEMDIDTLSKNLLKIVIENAGAQKGVLILLENDSSEFKSIYHIDERGSVSLIDNESDRHRVFSKSVINYVSRTRQAVVIGNAVEGVGFYNDDTYIKDNNVKSILCMPLVREDVIQAFLYLENNQIPEAFIEDRTNVLSILASQATIAIQNAKFVEMTRASERRYRGIFENASDGIFQSRIAGGIVAANNALALMLGYEKPAQLKKEVGDLTHLMSGGPGKREAFLQMINEKGQIKNMEVDFIRKDGSIMAGLINAHVTFVSEEGSATYYEGSVQDITKQKEMNSLMLQKEAAEAKALARSNFMANMSHDIRTPINTILGFSELLKENLPNDTILNEYIGNICSSGNLLLSIINEILEFSKIESGKIKLNYSAVNILAVFEDIAAQFEERIREKGLDFRIKTDLFFKDLFVKLDEVRLKKIIINVIDNAYKYTEKGFINVIVQKNSVSGNRLDMSITVEDSGPGITDKERIFEEFEQIQPTPEKIIEGAGLGLAIVKKLVSLMQGTIKLESSKSMGTKFVVRFPKIEIEQGENGETDKGIDYETDVIFEDQVVLVADDNQKNRSLIREYTKNIGLKLVEAKNGKEAVNIIETQEVSLVLIDIKMPIMSGIEATRIIKQGNHANVPIIALTADISEQTRDEAISSGVDSLILKPIRKKILLRELMNWLPYRRIDTTGPKTNQNGIKVKIDIDPNRKDQILKALKTLMDFELEKITKKMIISDITKFAGKVEKIGCVFGSCYVEEWGKLLRKNAENYRNKKTQELLNQYPKLIEKIEGIQ